jgi:hypothetical protein
VIFGFEFIGGIDIDESDTNGWISVTGNGGVLNVGDGGIIRSESFEDVVVVVEVEDNGVSHDFFLFDYRSTLPKF